MPIDITIRNYEGDESQILDEIIEKLWLAKIKSGIPVIVGVVGKSAHGKSSFIIYVQQKIYEKLGLDYLDYVQENILLQPLDYAPKMRRVLYDKDLTKVCTLQMDEAKFLLNSDSWQSFKNKATRTITSTCRTIKPMLFFILAQKRKDIDAKTRDSLDYYVEVKRKPGRKPVVEIFEIYESDAKFSQPEMEKRPITIRLDKGDDEEQTIMPLIKPSMPREDIWKKYKSFEEPGKSTEILKILDEMEKDARKIAGQSDEKIKDFVKYLKDNPMEMEKIGSVKRGKWKVDKSKVELMGYGRGQIKEIENMLLDSIENFEGQKESGE